jgi:hypothetical protein
VQPRLTSAIVMPTVDGFLQDVRVVTTETSHFLVQTAPNVSHEVVVTDMPQVITMRQNTLHALAGCFENVLAQRFGIERWQIAMPEDGRPLCVNLSHDEVAVTWIRCLHVVTILEGDRGPQPTRSQAGRRLDESGSGLSVTRRKTPYAASRNQRADIGAGINGNNIVPSDPRSLALARRRRNSPHDQQISSAECELALIESAQTGLRGGTMSTQRWMARCALIAAALSVTFGGVARVEAGGQAPPTAKAVANAIDGEESAHLQHGARPLRGLSRFAPEELRAAFGVTSAPQNNSFVTRWRPPRRATATLDAHPVACETANGPSRPCQHRRPPKRV